MNKADIICKLRANNYSFENEGDQVVVELARRYFLKLDIENDHVVKIKDELKQFGLMDGKSLKAVTKIGVIGYSIFISLIALWSILDPNFFFTGGKYFFILITPTVLYQLFEFWDYNKRLSKIKTLLHLND